MRSSRTASTLLLLLLAAGPATPQSDERALEIAQRSMDAMGGRAAFEGIRLLRFDWAVDREGERVAHYRHWWDRYTGDYRLEGKTRDGDSLRVLFNLETRDGEAWLNGEQLDGEARAEQLEFAYGRFINDSYWLIMPWKWTDPGVHLAYEGERTLAGQGLRGGRPQLRRRYGADLGRPLLGLRLPRLRPHGALGVRAADRRGRARRRRADRLALGGLGGYRGGRALVDVQDPAVGGRARRVDRLPARRGDAGHRRAGPARAPPGSAGGAADGRRRDRAGRARRPRPADRAEPRRAHRGAGRPGPPRGAPAGADRPRPGHGRRSPRTGRRCT